jgi:hypothetical protein
VGEWLDAIGLPKEADQLASFDVTGATMKQLCKGDGAQGSLALEEIGAQQAKIVQAKILGEWEVKRGRCQ